MHTRTRLVGLTIGLFASVALIAGCQSSDDSVLTEVERFVEPAAAPTVAEINTLIKDLIGDPRIERSSLSQFKNIARSTSETDRVKRAKALFDYLTKHYLGGKWVDDGGVKTAELILAIGQFVGLYPEGEGSGAMCQPGNDCEAEPTTGVTTIPAALVTQPFTLIMTETECDPLFGPNVVEPCYEITTYPEGIDFNTPPSGSLSLSDFTSPFVALCSDFAQNYEVGTEVFLWHVHDGVVEQVDSEPVTICDGGPVAELNSQWANPLLAAFRPVLSILSPQPLYAGGRGVGVGGAINSFSDVASCLPGCFPTTSTLSVVSGGPILHPGESITLRVTVSPVPTDDPEGVFFFNQTVPVATAAAIVDGISEYTLVCGEDPYAEVGNTYDMSGIYRGSAGYATSQSSPPIQFSCVAAEE